MVDDPLGLMNDDADLSSLYNGVKRAFREAGIATPDLDARLLVTETLGVSTAQLIANPRMRISPELAAELVTHARERIAGRSIGRILGRRAFWSLDLRINQSTLEPRPETETVVELALQMLQPVETEALIADLGVGTGAILLSILSERLNAFGVGVDISEDALREAERNAERNNLADRAFFVVSNFGAALAKRFDVVVSNPPYIATSVIESLDPIVRDNDPRLALDGGVDGLDAYRIVFAQADEMMLPTGTLIVEIDPNAQAEVIREAERCGLSAVSIATDLNGDTRAIALRRTNA
ncbi:peptide chain release factor N(5)-glutamine methyltransferase [Acuticoccus sp. M5D2P5]|uniref:peptide chain release factor N(5)-glutamine methyltransferase n=1 Tax=Acuticoccus kalidii TaxID=2910977 RepID=UPI001F38523E|nr:peptide chain release factor N(5)-glutamine methyltransferase [Acuticoccus kalidii]MCF3934192.1 peptide chain release factor N(5)-glutamine methyltransferase [Acuticoccus kalidii]